MIPAGRHSPDRAAICLWAIATVLSAATAANGLIDPERPVSWLVSQCEAIATMKLVAVEKGSATLAVVKVLKGEVRFKEITVHWSDTQAPPVERKSIGASAVFLSPRDGRDPTLLQVSPEYLSLSACKGKAGEYDFVRLNGFVKGSFNGEADDFIRLLEDTLAQRAYFPIWADTSFAAARKMADLPCAVTCLAVGDIDGDGKLDIVAATPTGLFAFTDEGGDLKFAGRALRGVGPTTRVELADADGDGRLDILAESGLFLNKGGWRFAAVAALAGRDWSSAHFCRVPGRPAPAIAAIEAGRVRIFARAGADQDAWADISGELGLDTFFEKSPGGILAVHVAASADRLTVALASADRLTLLTAARGEPLKVTQSFPLIEPGKPLLNHPHIASRDLDGSGAEGLVVAFDGGLRWFRPTAAGSLREAADYLGDVRKLIEPVEGCCGLICEDLNNDGLVDVLVWSRSGKISLIMNRGYGNLRDGTEVFDLPAALKALDGIQAVAVADVDGDGDLDLVVASGKSLCLLANRFEIAPDPEEANDRPRRPLLTIRLAGKNRFGGWMTIEDKDGKPIASRAVGSGSAADTLYFGYRDRVPAAAILTAPDGKATRLAIPAGQGAKPMVFK